MTKLIDTHFHLDHYRNFLDVSSSINQLKQYTICVTNSPGVFLSCKNSISETKYLKFAIGFHPQDSNLSDQELKDFMHLIDRTSYVGEIGLDFTANKSYMPKSQQLLFFEKIVEVCASKNKLMTIHSRGAEVETLTILKKYAPKKAIIHWYTGNIDCLMQLLEIGCYFSVNSNMVAGKSRDKYLLIPKDRLLIESDGPYTKISGNKFEPCMLRQGYDLIGDFFSDPFIDSSVFNNFNELLLK